jgi:hypothetical protein
MHLDVILHFWQSQLEQWKYSQIGYLIVSSYYLAPTNMQPLIL